MPEHPILPACQAPDHSGAFLPRLPLPPNLPSYPIPIAEMADAFGVTHRTLHFYEEKGLLLASRSGARRTYSPEQVRMMAFITFCRETGMPIAQIQDLLQDIEAAASEEEADTLFRLSLTARRAELAANQALLRRQMQQIAEFLAVDDSREGGNQGMEKAPFLTEFENTCLALMAEGYTPVRIANATRRPIDDILQIEFAIIRKFGSSNRFQAVAKAVLLGLVGE